MTTPTQENDVEQQQETSCFGSKKDKVQYGTGKSIIVEFRDFIFGGNLIRIAVAFVLALSIERLVTSFVSSFVTPILGIIGDTDFEELKFTIRQSNFVYGLFLDALISFIIIALVLFFCLILPTQRYGGRCVPAWILRKCPYCCQDMPAIATKCPSCCSSVEAVPIGQKVA